MKSKSVMTVDKQEKKDCMLENIIPSQFGFYLKQVHKCLKYQEENPVVTV